MQYELPSTLNEALDIRASGEWQIIAGGTDVYLATVELTRYFTVKVGMRF